MIDKANFNVQSFRKWMEERASRLTAMQYERNINQMMDMFGTDISRINDNMQEAFVRYGCCTKGKKVSKSSCILRRSAMIAFRKWMKHVHGIDDWGLHLEDIELPRAEHKIPECMTQEEIEKMIEHAKVPRERCMFYLLYSCGLRASELTHLTYQDVNLKDMEITVTGKGDKQRKCYLSSRAVKYLKEVFLEQKKWNAWEYIFLDEDNHLIRDQNLGNMFNQCAKRAGIKRHVHPHMMRHSFATKLLRNGVDIMTIKEMMGHSSINTTQIYLTVENDEKKKAFRKTFGNEED